MIAVKKSTRLIFPFFPFCNFPELLQLESNNREAEMSAYRVSPAGVDQDVSNLRDIAFES